MSYQHSSETYLPHADVFTDQVSQEHVSPLARFLRVLELGSSDHWKPLDEWFTDSREMKESILLNYSFIKAVPMDTSKNNEEDEIQFNTKKTKEIRTVENVISASSFIHGRGNDLEDLAYGHRVELDALNTVVEAMKIISYTKNNNNMNNKESNIMLTETKAKEILDFDDDNDMDNMNELSHCYIHERVARTLKSDRVPWEEVYSFLRDKVINGAFIRRQHQYCKKVDRDVRELRLNSKERVIYARQGNALLILALVWDHKLNTPIARAQKEMDVMKHWMKANGVSSEPFVIIDATSGRLRPLYKITILHNKSGEVSFVTPSASASNIYNPSIFDLVLSPQQEQVHSEIISASSASNTISKQFAHMDMNKDHRHIHENEEEKEEGFISRKGTKPPIKMVFIQGSAGNGKTTCLLTGGLSRAEQGEVVVLICATSYLAESINEDLKGSALSADKCIVKTLKELKEEVINWLVASEKARREELLTREEILEFLRSIRSYDKSKSIDEETEIFLAEWFYSGSKESDNSIAYKAYSDRYIAWKRGIGKMDEGDMWTIALELLQVVDSPWDREVPPGILIVDEAQLYPADSLFKIFLEWFHPTRCILVGMDTKQAIILGCSKREELKKAARDACDVVGWADVDVSVNNLTTNFRLPAKMIALSNAMVSIFREFLPGIFDEYSKDTGYESRVTTEIENEVDDIMSFPCLIASGEAGKKLRCLIRRKMDANGGALTTLRFADLSDDVEVDSLSGLASIDFQSCSGLESALPIIVDNLMAFVAKTCKRSVFSARMVRGKEMQLDSSDMSRLQTALCRVYTVMTRCRGPLIWIENADLREHALIEKLKDRLKDSKLSIEFITNESKITEAFVDKIFAPVGGDIEELNVAWEDTIKILLTTVRKSLHDCIKECGDSLSKSENPIKVYSLNNLRDSSRALRNALQLFRTPDVIEFVSAVQLFIQLFEFHEGKWAIGNNDELKSLLKIASIFPKMTGKILSECTKRVLSPVVWTSIHEKIIHKSLKLCMCGSFPRDKAELVHICMFNGPQLTRSIDKSSTNGNILWVITKVNSSNIKRNKCITQNSFVLSCYSNKMILDSCIIYRFDARCTLQIFKNDDNWLDFHEISVDKSLKVTFTTTNNAGMKCRCEKSKRNGSVVGLAVQNCYGQAAVVNQAFPTEIQACEVRFGRFVLKVMPSPMIRASKVDDEPIIAYLSSLLQGTKADEIAIAKRSAAMIWNNLFAGRVYLAEVETRLQPWQMLGLSDVDVLKQSMEAYQIKAGELVSDFRSLLPLPSLDEESEQELADGTQL